MTSTGGNVYSDLNDLDLLRLETATISVLTETGRMLRSRSPEQKPGPRMSLVRSRSGNAVWLRHDVDDAMAREIGRIVAREPPSGDPRTPPTYLADYLRILAAEPPDLQNNGGPIYTFPDDVRSPHPAQLIRSGTDDGDRLIERLEREGMPESLSSVGVVDAGEFWEPWCTAFEGEEIASIAFTVGMSPEGAEVGVCSMVAFRGRGFAAAAVAGWGSHSEVRGKTRFYSTAWSNVSSQRVTDRLGLRFVGTRFTID